MEEKHFEALYPENALFSEIDKLLGFVKAGKSGQLIGLPGAGRSDLLELLAYNKNIRDKHLGENSKYVHFVLVDFSELRKRPLFDVMKLSLLLMVDMLSCRN